ncbi:MFS transporter [Candidatus Parcubacteria bacterium]|nr:MFS transporter [Candidatus Parcubacteria bacterium]
MNRTLKYLMITDIFYFTGFGLIAPIVAIFIKEDLTGGTIFAAGIATTLFILVKSVVQLPFSKYVDKHDNKLLWLKIGYGLIIFNPFIYLLADHINYIYLAEVIHGIGSGIAFPAWLGLWSTHLDKGHESFEWSLYSTVVGLGAAATAGIGAAMAQYLGFTVTFLFVGIMAICSFITLFFLEKKVENPKKSSAKQYHIRRKTVNNHTFK